MIILLWTPKTKTPSPHYQGFWGASPEILSSGKMWDVDGCGMWEGMSQIPIFLLFWVAGPGQSSLR
jgi:hypothetical protein